MGSLPGDAGSAARLPRTWGAESEVLRQGGGAGLGRAGAGPRGSARVTVVRAPVWRGPRAAQAGS